jgi:hypothetical protein
MEVAIESNTKTPFQKEIREWQHVDPNTGALINSRLEADRWVNGPLNTYGKVSLNIFFYFSFSFFATICDKYIN